MSIVRSRKRASAGAEMNRRDVWLVANDIKMRRKRASRKRRKAERDAKRAARELKAQRDRENAAKVLGKKLDNPV